jgi:hypothetical protein
MVDPAAVLGRGAVRGQWAGGAQTAEFSLPDVTACPGVDRHGVARRAGHGLGVEVDIEAVLGEMALHRRGRLHLESIVDTSTVQLFQQFPSTIGGITIDRRPVPPVPSFGGQDVGQQGFGCLGVTAVASGDLGGGDDL